MTALAQARKTFREAGTGGPRVVVAATGAESALSLADSVERLGGEPIRVAGSAELRLKLEIQRPQLLLCEADFGQGFDVLLEEAGRICPGLPIVVANRHPSADEAVRAMRAGACDYLSIPCPPERLGARLAEVRICQDDEPVAVDRRSRELLALTRRVAASDVTVTLNGESGTGKEVLARYLHGHSSHADGPFVAVNCAAIPESMLESILFGHEKGAFTGAHRSAQGKFEQAQGGTLLLDEISEMPLGLQAKLLRVLQEREVERLGAARPVALRVRVIATTNRNLREAVRAGTFREDLYYRLHVFPLHIAPLRVRPGDILPLTRHFMRRHAGNGMVPRLDPGAEQALLRHNWPGNCRELENLVQRCLIMAHGPLIGPAELCFEAGPDPSAGESGADLGAKLRDEEHALILEALEQGGGSRQQAAARLGISARTLRYKLARMREAGLPVPSPGRG